MNFNEFLNELSEILILDEMPSADVKLSSIESYDSMSQLSILSLFDEELGIEIEGEQLRELVTLQDLYNLAGFSGD